MTIAPDLPADLAESLLAEAERRSQTDEGYARSVLETYPGSIKALDCSPGLAPEEEAGPMPAMDQMSTGLGIPARHVLARRRARLGGR